MAGNTVQFVQVVGKLPKNVIVDVDTGTDDAWALLMLLAAEAKQDIRILAITCVRGNTTLDHVCTNVLRILDSVNRLDIPVYRGAEEPLIPPEVYESSDTHQYHGEDGFGDVEYETAPDLSAIQSENAVCALERIAAETEVSLVCLAPLTNIALAMKTYAYFASTIKSIFIMGGNSTGMGNVTSCAEFNFYFDAEAAQIVLRCARCPIFMLPWETCLKAPLTLEWRFEVLGSIRNKQMSLLNAAEASIFRRLACAEMLSCDQLLTAALLRPDMVTECRSAHMTVELQGRHTRGQAVLDHANARKANVTLILDVDVGVFKHMMLLAAGHDVPEAEVM